MKTTVSAAKGQLTDLVRRAESGEEIVLTRRGQDVARIVPVQKVRAENLRAIVERIQREARAAAKRGPSAAKSADFLYDERGLPK
jgi:prevent-host-death family protein